MGTVHLAERVKLGRAVAIKFLRPAFARQHDFVRRFEREALAMSRIYHPHCVSIIDYGMHEDSPYLVMEYVPGRSLARILHESGPLPARRAIRIVLQVLDTLGYFHRRNVLHRDLKAENIMIAGDEDEEDFVKLLDLGMAKLLSGVGADISVSAKGVVAGTPSAMSPEQIRELPLDGRADIYSTGVLLYHMLTGKRPFYSEDMVAVFKMHLEKPVVPPSEIVGTRAISSELDAVVVKALAKNRDERYQDCDAMSDALAATREAHQPSRRASTQASIGMPAARPAWFAYGGWALAAVLAVVVGWQVMRGGGELRTRSVTVSDPAVGDAVAGDSVVGDSVVGDPVVGDPVSAVPEVDAAVAAVVGSLDAAVDAPPAVVDSQAWATELAQAHELLARRDYRGTLRATTALVRTHPEARGDREVARVAVGTLAAPYGDVFIATLLRDFGAEPPLVDTLADAVTSADAWYTRHHAWLALQRAKHGDRADRVGMWIADLERAASCSEERRARATLRGSRDPRAAEALATPRAESRCSGPKALAPPTAPPTPP